MLRRSSDQLSVLALTRYEDRGASSRARFFEYIPFLKDVGISVTPAPLLTNDYLERLYKDGTRSRVDVGKSYWKRVGTLISHTSSLLWIEKELLPFAPGEIEYLLWRSCRVVIDFDDAIEDRYARWWWCGQRKFSHLLPRASLVTVGSESLRCWAESRGARTVKTLPSAVDCHRLTPTSSRAAGPLRIGWIGTPETVHYLTGIASTLTALSSELSFELHVIGATASIPGVSVRSFEWSLERESSLLSSLDIGIMPLSDDLWSRNKCGYKLIQYAASGVPAVASAIGENTTIVRHGETGYLVNSISEWVSYLRHLAHNADLRTEMGRKARVHAEQNYSHRVIGPLVASYLHEALRP